MIEKGEEESVQFFNDWVAEVKKNVPEDRLLLFQAKEGWQPLCEFLGVPQPTNQPFPNVNDSAAMRRHFKRMELIPKALLTSLLCLIVAIIFNFAL